jgi:hypothetical protein
MKQFEPLITPQPEVLYKILRQLQEKVTVKI